jgi:hypothetical protein
MSTTTAERAQKRKMTDILVAQMTQAGYSKPFIEELTKRLHVYDELVPQVRALLFANVKNDAEERQQAMRGMYDVLCEWQLLHPSDGVQPPEVTAQNQASLFERLLPLAVNIAKHARDGAVGPMWGCPRYTAAVSAEKDINALDALLVETTFLPPNEVKA